MKDDLLPSLVDRNIQIFHIDRSGKFQPDTRPADVDRH